LFHLSPKKFKVALHLEGSHSHLLCCIPSFYYFLQLQLVVWLVMFFFKSFASCLWNMLFLYACLLNFLCWVFVTLYMCSHHGHQVHVLLMMSIILVMELLQETFVEVNFASPTFFNGYHHKFTTNVQILIFLFFLALHKYRIMCVLKTLFDVLGHWMKPHSMTCFSRFFLTKYDEDWWVEFFWMTK